VTRQQRPACLPPCSPPPPASLRPHRARPALAFAKGGKQARAQSVSAKRWKEQPQKVQKADSSRLTK
jgi:hypothetical protein